MDDTQLGRKASQPRVERNGYAMGKAARKIKSVVLPRMF